MKDRKKNQKSFIPLWISVTLFIILAISSTLKKSPVYDETLHLADGIAYREFSNFRFGIEHPPLLRYIAGLSGYFAKAILPAREHLIRTDEEIRVNKWSPSKDFAFADKVFFINGSDTDRLLFTGRLLLLLVGIPLIIILHRWAKELYGGRAADISALMLALSPNLLAHAGLVTTDFGSAAFAVMAAYFLWRYTKKQDLKNYLLSSTLWALSLSSKHSAVFYFSIFQLSAFCWTGDKKKFAMHFLIQIPLLIFIINLCYGFTEPVCGAFFHADELKSLPLFVRGPLNLAAKISFLPETYLKGIAYSFFHSRRGHSAYLLGMYSVKGWLYYFPLAMLLKSTLAGIVLAALSALSVKSLKIKKDEMFFILPSAAFLIFMMLSNLNIGIRHVILLWPFGFLFFSRAAKLLKGRAPAAIAALAIFENLLIFPDYISHFNFTLGGPKQGIKYLGDSNLDWGQGLKQLAQWWEKEGKPPLTLSYFGSGSPEYYGIRYQGCLMATPVERGGEMISAENTGKEYFALSATNLQGIYLGHYSRPFGYFLSIKPVKICGSSIYIYDISDDYKARLIMGSIYHARRQKARAESEFRKAVKLNPSAEKIIRDYFSEKQ